MIKMKNKQIQKIELHLKDILRECNGNKFDRQQIIHNVFEIREHLKNEEYI